MLILALLTATNSACATWVDVTSNVEAVDVPATSDCDSLIEAARRRGLETYVEAEEMPFLLQALAVDETLVIRAKTSRIILGHWLSVGREIPRGWSARLECPELGARELEVRTCSARGRRFGVIDPSPVADWLGAGTPERPCELTIVHELRRESVPSRGSVILRRSIRAWLEGPS